MTATIISFGQTLARKMRAIEAVTCLSQIDNSNVIGVVHIAVVKGAADDLADVQCFLDEIDPALAVVGLRIAEQRLRILHNIDTDKLKDYVVASVDIGAQRRTAEELVDMVRSGRVGIRLESLNHKFDHSREACVRALMAALAKTSEASS